VSPAGLLGATVSDLLQDTRDRVVRLDARFEDLLVKVNKNSSMLEELHRLHMQAQGAGKFGAALWAAGRYALSGVSGAGLIAALHHWGKMGVVLALMATLPWWAWAAEGWELEIEACGEWHGCLRTRRNLGGAWLCEQAAADVHKAVPSSSPEVWGFPEGTKVRVKAVCVRGESRA
jgi:hypothetical protein